MKRLTLAALLVALIAAPGIAKKPKVTESVTYAKTWDAAVAEAKMLNLPLVVHCHGFR